MSMCSPVSCVIGVTRRHTASFNGSVRCTYSVRVSDARSGRRGPPWWAHDVTPAIGRKDASGHRARPARARIHPSHPPGSRRTRTASGSYEGVVGPVGGGPGRRPPASLIVQGRSPTHGRCGRHATDRRGGSAVVQVCIYAPCMWCGVDRTTYVCRTGADDRQPRAILTDVLHPRRDNVGHVCTVSPEASEAGLKDRSTPVHDALARNAYLNSESPGRLTPTRRPTSTLRIPIRHPMHTGRPLRLRRSVKSYSDETYTRAHKCASQGAPICHATYPRPCLYYHRACVSVAASPRATCHYRV